MPRKRTENGQEPRGDNVGKVIEIKGVVIDAVFPGELPEINNALQTIIGHCDLLERGYPDPDLQRDLAMVVRQAQRIAELLDRMRAASQDRLKEVAAAVNQGGIPSSPEAYGSAEVT